MTRPTSPSLPPARPTGSHHRGVPRWRRASRATTVLVVLGATVWGVQLGVAAPNASPVDLPAVSVPGAEVVDAPAVPAPVAGRTGDGPGRGGGGGRRG